MVRNALCMSSYLTDSCYHMQQQERRLLYCPLYTGWFFRYLDPRKCKYLKDYLLDFEHAYMTTYLASWEAFRYFFASLWHVKTFSSTRLWILLAIWKSSTILWINLMMTSSETAIFSRIEPHATPLMRAWPKSKVFLMTGLFQKPYGRQDLLT